MPVTAGLILTVFSALGPVVSSEDPTWDWEILVQYGEFGAYSTLSGSVSDWMACENDWEIIEEKATSGGEQEELYRADYDTLILSFTFQDESERTETWLGCDGAYLEELPENPGTTAESCNTPDAYDVPPALLGGQCSYSCQAEQTLFLTGGGFFPSGSTSCDGASASCQWSISSPMLCGDASNGRTYYAATGQCSATGYPLLIGNCAAGFT